MNCPRCSNPTKTRVSKPAGGGRVYCNCGWTDRHPSETNISTETNIDHQKPRGHGVTIIGQNESAKGVEIIGGTR